MYSPTELRDQACRLAPQDLDAAVAIARRNPHPWFRAQALAHAAGYAQGARTLELAREATEAANMGDDAYERSAVLAWPIAALVKTGHADEAKRLLARAVEIAESTTPPSSRAEALVLLLQTAVSLDGPERLDIVERLARLALTETHWRVQRGLRKGLSLLAGCDLDAAERIAESAARSATPRDASRMQRAITDTTQPRSFF